MTRCGPEQWCELIPATLKTFLQGCLEERKDQELTMLNISSVSGTIHGWGNEGDIPIDRKTAGLTWRRGEYLPAAGRVGIHRHHAEGVSPRADSGEKREGPGAACGETDRAQHFVGGPSWWPGYGPTTTVPEMTLFGVPSSPWPRCMPGQLQHGGGWTRTRITDGRTGEDTLRFICSAHEGISSARAESWPAKF